MANQRQLSKTFRVLSLAALLGLSLTGCDRFKSADSLYRDAEARYQKGEEKAAMIQLQNALQRQANHGPARLLLAKISNELGYFATAEREARAALAAGMTAEQVELELARALFGQGKFQEALNEAKLLPGLTGEALAKVLVVRGNAQLSLNQMEDAKASYEAAIQVAEQYYGGYIGRARVAAVSKNEAEAMRQIDIALQKSPKSVEALILKGDLLRAQGQNEAAAAAFSEALKTREGDIDARLRLVSVYMDMNKLDQARSEVERARKISPGNLMVIYAAALIDFREGKFVQARDDVLQVLRAAPDHLPSIVLFGAVSYQLGAYEQAEKKLTYAVEQLPQNAFARRLLISTLIKRNEAQRALEMLQPLLTQYPTDPHVLTLAGEAYLAARDPKKAAEYFEKAVATADTSLIRSRLAISRLASGEIERGIADLEKASSLDAKQFQADKLLIVTLMRQQKFDKALAAIDVLEKKLPNSALVYTLRGGVYLVQENRPAARKAYEQALAIDPAFIDAAANLAQMDEQDKNLAAARGRFERVLAKDKTNVRAMLALADLAIKENKEADYLSWIQQAAKADPTAFEPNARLVAYYLGKKDNQRALALAGTVQAANPDSALALELLGRAQLVAGEKESARITYRRLAEIQPDTAPAHYGLAVAQMQLEQFDLARASLRRALELKPDFVDAAGALVALELQQKNVPAATQVARQLQTNNAKSGSGWALEGEILAGQNQVAEAIAKFEKAQSIEPKSEIAIRLHQLRLAANMPGADAALMQWLKAAPNDLKVRAYYAGSLLNRKAYKGAIEQYEFIVQHAPPSPLILNNLATAYNETGDPRALATAEQAYKLAPSNSALQDTLGWILFKQGQVTRAKELLAQAAKGLPNDANVRAHYTAVFEASQK